ncbi:hypothetical protein ACM25N_13660 [Roseovarius sp. C7]|uniref:hypothetical protein n=1 Tax=Roseovarius sp. C7 TaxID=3398643 RepID=UPI0039F690EF
MKFMQTTALALSMSIAGFAASADMPKVSAVEVEANLSSYDDSNALEFWPTLDDDLGKAIASHLEFDDASAPRVEVQLTKVAIDGDTVLPDSGEFNHLEGIIAVHSGLELDNTTEGRSEPEVLQSFPLTVVAMTGEGMDLPEGWYLVPPSQEDFYDAMVAAYAEKVVERLDFD